MGVEKAQILFKRDWLVIKYVIPRTVEQGNTEHNAMNYF
jgi:hypothetical protein